MFKKVLRFISIMLMTAAMASPIAWAIISEATAKIEVVTETKDIVVPYKSSLKYNATKREGTTEVTQAGKNGKKQEIYEVTYKNGKVQKKELIKSAVLEEPVEQITEKGTKRYYKCSNGVEYETQEEKDNCEKYISWEKTKNERLAECNADSSKFNCWYDEYPGTYLHWSYYTYNRNYNYTPNYYTPNITAPKSSLNRSGAICSDGWHSSATGRGACSHHGGVSTWLY